MCWWLFKKKKYEGFEVSPEDRAWMEAEEARQAEEREFIDNLAKSIVKDAPSYKQRLIAIFNWIQLNIAYVPDEPGKDIWYSSYTVVTVLKQGDCEERAYLYTDLCGSLGYSEYVRPCLGVLEFPGNPKGHVWLEAEINGIWKIVELSQDGLAQTVDDFQRKDWSPSIYRKI